MKDHRMVSNAALKCKGYGLTELRWIGNEVRSTSQDFRLNGFILNRNERLSTYQLVVTVVMKNWEPLVSGPALAIDRSPEKYRDKEVTKQ